MLLLTLGLFSYIDNLWTSNNSFLWSNKLNEPLYEMIVTLGSAGSAATIEKKIILEKTGYCRSISFPESDVHSPIVSYSGNILHFVTKY